ncbi:MAG TPA: dihydrofolate reductase family protein [Candidatus Saccharimonadales bacterium]|nr:dihydrofolate reductase family protein [Candidatus Saccharimonadales bacterium]
MKVILYATISPNGFIARENGDEDFLPDSGWDAVKKDIAEAGNFIIGHHTYKLIEPQIFDEINATRVVVSSQPIQVRTGYIVAGSPNEAIEFLTKEGHQTALVIGGSGLNSSFMKLGLVDELHFYVVPHIIGTGIPIFAGDFECELEFVSNEPFAEGFISKYEVGR